LIGPVQAAGAAEAGDAPSAKAPATAAEINEMALNEFFPATFDMRVPCPGQDDFQQ
jgi:hypothetical protein